MKRAQVLEQLARSKREPAAGFGGARDGPFFDAPIQLPIDIPAQFDVSLFV